MIAENIGNGAETMIQAISFQEGKHILDTYPGSVLLDVRTEDEYALEHAAGAKAAAAG